MELSGTVKRPTLGGGVLVKEWGIPPDKITFSNFWRSYPQVDMMMTYLMDIDPPEGTRRLKSPDPRAPSPTNPEGLDLMPIAPRRFIKRREVDGHMAFHSPGDSDKDYYVHIEGMEKL